MHAWLAFIAGVFVVTAGFLIVSASFGIAVGLAFEVEITLAIVFLVVAGIAAWLFYEGFRAQYRKVKTGKEALIGATGIATTDLKPKGEIRILGEFWQAKTKDGEIANGQTVTVVDMDGMFLVVQPAEQKA